MSTFGYARVSGTGQELDIQLAELRGAGCGRIYCDKESGLHDDRKQLRKMLRAIGPGDVVLVAALDRVTRTGSYMMLSILHEINARGAVCRSLAEPWADITQDLGDVLAAIVGYLARKTRDDIVRRTSAGRERARANGVKFGRRPKLNPVQQEQARARLAAGESQTAVARAYQVSCSTISRIGATAGELAT